MKTINPDLPRVSSIVHALATAVSESPATTALVCDDKSITYAEYGRAVAGLANILIDMGVKDDRVVIMMSNSIEMTVAMLAVMAAGAQMAPVNPYFKGAELEQVLTRAEAKIIISDTAALDKATALAPKVGVNEVLLFGPDGFMLEDWIHNSELKLLDSHLPDTDDLGLLIFSGGTTGVPKGISHAHKSLAYSLMLHATAWPLDFGAEHFLSVTPMFHIWGLEYATWIPIYSHSTLFIIPKFDADAVLEAIDTHKITVFAGGPAPIYASLMTSEQMEQTDFSSLKYCITGGAPCPEDVHRAWKQATGCTLFEGWGMSEGAPICLTTIDCPPKWLAVGYPVAETDVQVVDFETGTRILPVNEVGELRTRGPQFAIGYRNLPGESAQLLRDGWLYTGDIGYFDEEGYVHLVDRRKEMVIVGGYNVYPRMVDEILTSHPKIVEAATIGKPHERLGEVIVAFVVLKAGEEMDEEEFFDYCKDNMVKYKRPVEVTFMESLPRTGAGKFDKRALKSSIA